MEAISIHPSKSKFLLFRDKLKEEKVHVLLLYLGVQINQSSQMIR